jgi:hypothetical protein
VLCSNFIVYERGTQIIPHHAQVQLLAYDAGVVGSLVHVGEHKQMLQTTNYPTETGKVPGHRLGHICIGFQDLLSKRLQVGWALEGIDMCDDGSAHSCSPLLHAPKSILCLFNPDGIGPKCNQQTI